MHTSQTHVNTENDFMSDSDVLEAAGDLVEVFLTTLREEGPGTDILDTDCLPNSKTRIENGFCLAIVTESREPVRRRLVAAGKRLAQFQSDVGPRISLRPAADGIGNGLFGALSSRRLERLLASMEMDHIRLSALFEHADEVARRRFGVQVPSGFRDDGTYTWYGHARSH